MEQQTNHQKTPNSAHQKLQEIGKILTNAICRLEEKERSENKQILLDSNHFPSPHSVDANINQRGTL